MRRRKEGLCIFFYLWQTAVLAWFKLSTERATSQSAWNPLRLPPSSPEGLLLGHLLTTTDHPAGVGWSGGHGGSSNFHLSVVSKIKESDTVALPCDAFPFGGHAFEFLTAQPSLTGCENTMQDHWRGHRERSCVTTEKHGTPSHSPAGGLYQHLCVCPRHTHGSHMGGEPLCEGPSKDVGRMECLPAKRNVEGKPCQPSQASVGGHLSISETPTSPKGCPQGFLCWSHREVWSSERF